MEVTSVGRELLKLFQNSPFSLYQHDADLEEVMMTTALQSKFPNSKPNITELIVSMNEDKSCTVESCVKFINADDLLSCRMLSALQAPLTHDTSILHPLKIC